MTWYSRKMTLALVLLALLGLLLAGCSKKQDVETEPQVPVDAGQTEEIPEEPTPEPVDTTPPPPDYTAMSPQEYGVEDIYFAFDEYDLDNEAMAILNANARILRETGATILISGHCDERGTVEYNLALGEKRAQAVRDYLVSLNVPAQMLRITSYGESRPFAYGHNEDAWTSNRRAHFERP